MTPHHPTIDIERSNGLSHLPRAEQQLDLAEELVSTVGVDQLRDSVDRVIIETIVRNVGTKGLGQDFFYVGCLFNVGSSRHVKGVSS